MRTRHANALCAMRLLVTLGILLLLLPLLLSPPALAEPEGGYLNVTRSDSRVSDPAASIWVQAGNVSSFNIFGYTSTQSWAAFYGNISGTITLDDGGNYTIFDWSATSPDGEIYATTYSGLVDWSLGNVVCWNWTMDANGVGPPNIITPLEYERIFGMNSTDSGAAFDDADRMINSTFFSNRSHSGFYVGSYYVSGVHNGHFGETSNSACPTALLYSNASNIVDEFDGVQGSGTFEEMLLVQNNLTNGADQIIYASLLEDDAQAFNGEIVDFQMLIAENGHLGNAALTTYYFYVELE